MRPTVTSGPVVSYTAVSPLPACAGGLFSAALSLRSPWADVIRHRALRSPEVPQPCQMNDAAAAIWGSRISYYTAGQGFYAGESGWAGAPGETMNAECRIAVGGGAHPPAGGRWRVAPVGGHAGGGHPHSQLPTGCRRSAAASAHGSQDRIVARLAQAPPEHSIPLCRWPCLHARFCPNGLRPSALPCWQACRASVR